MKQRLFSILLGLYCLMAYDSIWACTPISNLKVQYESEGGFAYRHLSATVDAQTLPAEEATELRTLLNTADFWNLPADLMDPNPCCDRTEYTITVREEGKTHTIKTIDGKIPETLQPLIQWLRARATPMAPSH